MRLRLKRRIGDDDDPTRHGIVLPSIWAVELRASTNRITGNQGNNAGYTLLRMLADL